MIYSTLKKCIDSITHLFLTGLFTLMPIVITITFFSGSFKLIKSWLEPLQAIKIPYLMLIPHSEIILCIGVILLAGLFLKSLVLRSFMELGEAIVAQVPIVRTIYTGIKQLTSAFSPTDKVSFKKVVLVKFPQQETYSIGFLTSEFPQELSPENGSTFYNIFVPTTPNPTSGFFLIVKKEDFTPIDLTTQEAMAMIISGGIILPKKYESQK